MSRLFPRSILLTLTLVAMALVGADEPAQAVVAGGNGKIAFTAGTPAVRNVYVMNADGSNRTALTSTGSGVAGSPSWSPDGARVAFHFRVTGLGMPTTIDAVDADGTGWVTLQGAAQHSIDPSWSPDGSRFVFAGATGPSLFHLFVANADGTGLTQITSGLGSDITPSWSPDGSMIAFASDRTGTFKIYLVSPTGANRQRITFGSYMDLDPAWSPDGKLLAISSDRDGDLDVHLIDWPGAHIAQLTDSPGYDGEPAWSPDGSRLAFVSERTGNADVWVMDRDGNAERNLTRTSTDERGPDWQPGPPRAGPVDAPHTVGLVDPGTGIWRLRAADGSISSFYYGNPGDSPMLGDWDCDGVETPGLYRRSDGYVYLRNSNTAGIADVAFFFGDPGDIPLAGDFDGDGCDTVSVYRARTGQVFVVNALGSGSQGLGEADFSYYFGNPDDKPFVGDFTGNGIETVGLHRETTGLVYFRETHTQGIADHEFIFGDPGDRLVAGDWIADGIDTAALFRPSAQRFYQRFTNTQGVADRQFAFGQSDWLPVAGNFVGPPPSQVTGLTAGPGGGSGEVDVRWSASPEPDVDRYRVRYSLLPGGPYSLIAEVADVQVGWLPPGIRGYIDYPRLLVVGRNCYTIAAVNDAGNEGRASAEACFQP